MVLKRFYFMAFAGLTVGVGGMAWGQGTVYNDIPAPDIYGEITGCDSDTPDSVLTPAKSGANKGKSALDVALEGGDSVIDIMAGILTPCTTKTNSVSEGIGQARILYREADQARAGAMLEGASQDAIDDYNEAKAEKEAYGGAVYDKVYAESAANKAAAKAISDYNALFRADDTTTADVDESGVYTKAVAEFSALVINNLDTATDVEAENYVNTYGRDQIRGFQAINGFDTAEAADYDAAAVADGTAYAWTTAFDAATGELEFAQNDAMAVRDADGNITTYNNGAAGSTTITTLGELRTHLDSWNDLVRATAKAVADADPDTTSATALAAFRQDAARAVAARDHVQDEWDRLTSVVRRVDREPADTTSDSDKLDAYEMAKRTVSRHASNVRSTMSTLESATKALSDSLTSADDFLSQVVSSAKYSQSNLADDATEGQVTAAAKAVMDAEAALAAHMALTGDADNPAVALLDALLAPDTVQGKDNPADDDGQALITAISDTYETAKSAEDTAMNAMNAVEGLGGEDGQVNQNTMKIQENADSITALDGRVAQNEEDIAGNTTMIGENRSMITTNSENIATNATNIMTNASEIMRVEGRVDTNWDAIAANQMAISDNTAAIGMNTSAIADNAGRIGSNANAISDNRNMIGELSDSLEVVRAGVAASMALAGMPAINGRGVSIGIGSYDGESAFAVGFQIQGEMASFKVGVTSAGGETGASAGVGFQF